jgi:DNA-binding transcriptional LysR family regulator
VTRAKPVVVARKSHPQLSAGRLSLETYLEMGHVLVSSRAKGQGLEDLSLARRGLERKIVTRCQTLATAVDILENSDLLLTIPESYLGRFTNQGQLQTFNAPFTAPDFEIFVYWHENYELSKPSLWLRELIDQTFSQGLE